MKKNPIGILDSGVGGLSVWQELVKELPHESTVYIGDSKHCPYGNKPPEVVYELTRQSISFLLTKQVKLVVVACNTATVTSIDSIRNTFPQLPIVGIVPVVKSAVEHTRNGKIGILSTTNTAKSSYQKELISQYASACQVTTIGTDKLVPLIEQGEVKSPRMEAILSEVLLPFKEKSVDTVALGCSHFPFVKARIQEILGASVQLLDSGGAIGRQVHRILKHNHLLSTGTPSYSFYTTGEREQMAMFLRTVVMQKNGNKACDVYAV